MTQAPSLPVPREGQERRCCRRGPSLGEEFCGSPVGRLGEMLPQ